jgi:CRP-like cAMP-binding protein
MTMNRLVAIAPLERPGVSLAHETVGRNRLLGALQPDDLSLVHEHLQDCYLDKGKVLQDPEEPIENVYFPHGGMISMLVVLPDGQMVETMTMGREGAIGLSRGIGSRAAVGRAIVQLPGPAARIPAARWAELAQQSQALRNLIVRYNDVQLAQIQQSVACHALHGVEARLCRWLLEARDRMGSDTLPLTQEFLADTLGVRRTTVTIVARMLQSAGLVHYRRGIIQLRDVAALESAACDCYHVARGLTDRFLAAPS